jgi:hypothetical protein
VDNSVRKQVGILNIDTSQVKTNVRKRVGDIYITANQTDYSIRKQVGILYIAASQVDNSGMKQVRTVGHFCHSGVQQCKETCENCLTFMLFKWKTAKADKQ